MLPDVDVLEMAICWSRCPAGLTAALCNRSVLTLFKFPHCRTGLPICSFPPLRLEISPPTLLLEQAQWTLPPVLGCMTLKWRNGGIVVKIWLVLSSGATHWRTSASRRTWTRVLLMLVLATRTTPLQWIRLRLKSCLALFLTIRRTDEYLVPPNTLVTEVPRMPRTPLWTGSKVRNLEPCVDPVAFSVSLFLMTNSLAPLAAPSW